MHTSLDSFAAALTQVKTSAFQHFDREISEKSLCYHNYAHIHAVQQRASLIFQTLRPYLQAADTENADSLDRMALLLDFCAATHDLIQLFLPPTALHSPRRRESGMSEAATLATIFQLIDIHCPTTLTAADLAVIKAAIEATICAYDPTENSIFQPTLYQRETPIPWVARIVALADIGSLGIEGIASYNAEGSLLFLEENPDVLTLIQQQEIQHLALKSPELHENIRQRLLRRARFQVNLAKSRFHRLPQEISTFPSESIFVLSTQVFQYLTRETIQAIVQTTPTADDTTLETLLDFFKFEQFMVTAQIALAIA
jgi:hypothetical protein